MSYTVGVRRGRLDAVTYPGVTLAKAQAHDDTLGSSGGMTSTWLGGSLVSAAAFYYDEPQYRWFTRRWDLPQGSEGAGTVTVLRLR